MKKKRSNGIWKVATTTLATTATATGLATVAGIATLPLTGSVGLIILTTSLTGRVAKAGIERIKKSNKDKEEAKQKLFEEGVKAGEAGVKKKLHTLLSTQRKRDEFLLLVVKIGTYIAKCDGEISCEERLEIERFIGEINNSPFVPEVIRKRIKNIIESEVSFNEIIRSTKSLLAGENSQSKKEMLIFIDNLIHCMVYADGELHEKEEVFLEKWVKEFTKYG